MLGRRCLYHLAKTSLLAILLCGSAQVLRGQATATGGSNGFWKDGATGLIWVVKDNGSDVNWNQARDYCGSLHLGGYSDWRLPTIDELEAIYDSSLTKQYKIKGPIELGAACSLSETKNNSGDVWSFCFNSGGRNLGPPTGHGSQGRVLCVRRSGE